MIVGLTGGIGSGKSTIAHFFRQLGVPIYDSDQEAKNLMVDSESVKGAIIELFGQDAYIGKKLNKTFISRIVFEQREMLNRLNNIVHPAVRTHFLEWVENQDFPYVIQETALIFENNAHGNYDRVLLVTAPEDQRIQRVAIRDGLAEDQIRARISNQLPDSKKIELSDYVVENLDLGTTADKVKKIHNKLLEEALKKSAL